MQFIIFFRPSAQRSTCHRNTNQLPDRRRVCLALLVIYTYNKAEDGIRWTPGTTPTEAASLALCTIWRSMPASYLCRREFFGIFEGVVADSDKLKTASELYSKFVCEEEFTELAQPRSLGHFSRCQIRQVLASRKQLPDGVSKLPVPRLLKNYLSLEL